MKIITTLLFALGVFPVPNLCGQAQQPAEDFLTRQHVSSLAVFPPLGESVPSAARQMSADMFGSKLKLRSAAMRVVPAEAVATQLDQHGMTGDFGAFVNLYSQTGTVNSEALKRFGQTLGTDAVLFIYVLNYDEQKGSRWYGKGGRNLCRIQYTLFRSSSGEKIWESLEFRQHDSKLSTNPYPVERVIGDVSESAVTSLLSGRQNADVRQKPTK